MQPTLSATSVAANCAGESFWGFAANVSQAEGTPFYVYLPARARAAYLEFASGIASWGNGRVAFSVKTNPLLGLLTDLNRWGAFAEVVSGWEFSHAMAAGFLPEQIVFNGPLKTESDLRWIVHDPPLTINIDSLDELDALERMVKNGDPPVRVGVRLCPPREHGTWSRFGLEMSSGEADEAVSRILRNRTLGLRCIHFHLGTQVFDTDRYARMVALVRDRIWTRHHLGNAVSLDIGGGFPYDHALPLEEQPFSPLSFFAELAQAWGPKPRPLLLTEPGRFVSAPAMAIVSRVLACKPRPDEPTIVVVDSGTNHNVMAAFYEHAWSYGDAEEADSPHRLCGPLCMEDDILSGERRGPVPKTGTLVAMFNAGAYSVALSRTFIQPRPSLYALHGAGEYELLQSAETAARTYAFGGMNENRLASTKQSGG